MRSNEQAILFVGLRPAEFEWRAEIAAATSSNLEVQLASDASVPHPGVPGDRQILFASNGSADTDAANIVARLPRNPVAVTCWGDRYVGITAHIAERIGLRGPGVAAAAACTNKIAQRRLLMPLGLNPPWRAGSTIEQLRAAVAGLPTPLVFKLAHASGGIGTCLITDTTADADLEQVFARTALNYVESTDFVVEQYIGGSEHSVSGVVVDHEARVLAVSDKLLTEGGLETWATIVPSSGCPDTVAALTRATRAAVDAMGLQTGGFHVDLRYSETGPIVLEVGARLGGDTINSHLIPLASRHTITPYRALITALTHGVLPADGEFSATAAMLLLPTGHRPPHEVLARIREHSHVHAASIWSTVAYPAVCVIVAVDDPHILHGTIEELRNRS